VQVGLKGLLLMGVLERQRSQPPAAGDTPGLVGHPQPVAQQELAHAVAVAHPVQPDVLARTDEIAQRLDLLAGHRDRLQQPAGVQPRELARVARIGLDPITRLTGTSPGAMTSHAIPRERR